jgi:hypothetical protein
MNMVYNRRIVIVAILSVIVGAASIFHVWDARYYFRFLPLPFWAYELVSSVAGDKIFTPPPSKSFTDTLPVFDFDTVPGREQALNYVRTLVPVSAPPMTYESLTPQVWFDRIKRQRGYCTDFSLLLISLANRAGLRAREWILWHDDNWSLGSAHSIAEIRLNSGQWVALDGQHATILTANDAPISMNRALKLGSLMQTIETKRLPIADIVGLPEAASTKSALYRIPAGVVLNLHLGSWTGAKHLPLLAIPIIYGNSKIDWRIWSTKIAALLLVISAMAIVVVCRKK